MSLGRWAQRRSFYFAKFYFTFLHFLFFLIQFFHWWKIAWKGKTRVLLQEPYLIWYSSWGTTLIYNIPGLDSAYVLVWYWKTSVKNKVHKNLPLFKQTNNNKKPHQRKFLLTDVEDSVLGCRMDSSFPSASALGSILPLCPEFLWGKAFILPQMI